MTHWLTPVTLTGSHVRLEPLSTAHHDGLCEAVRDGELWRLWYTVIPEPAQMRHEIQRRLDEQVRGAMCPFALIDRVSGTPVGMTTYMNVDAANRRLEIGSTWIRHSAQRTQAAAQSSVWGAKLDGVLRSHQINLHPDAPGALRDTCVYSIIAAEWPTVRANLDYILVKTDAQRVSHHVPFAGNRRSTAQLQCSNCSGSRTCAGQKWKDLRMTTTPATRRPSRIKFSGHTADDGLFGPDSVTWRISALPQMGLAAHAAATLQMLHPMVMHMIDQASAFRTNPASRAELTALYGRTLTYGDTDAAHRAAEVLAKIHHRVTATDPVTGRTYHADEPDLLLWVHNTIHWMVLRVADSFGPALSTADKVSYLNEQLIAARLTGCIVDDVPTTEQDLYTYIEGMTPLLAVGSDTVWFKEMALPASVAWKPDTYLPHLLGIAVAGLMSAEQRQIYGVDRPAWQFEANRAILKGIFEAEARKIPVLSRISLERQKVDEKAFGSAH